MSSTVASHRDKRSLDYALRSGLAGGLAGCLVRTLLFLWYHLCSEGLCIFGRQKRPSHLSTESRFFSKPLTPTSRNMQVRDTRVSPPIAR